MQSPPDHLIGRRPECGAEADARNLEWIVLAAECQNSPARSKTNDKRRLGKFDSNGTGFCVGCRRKARCHHHTQECPARQRSNKSGKIALHIDLFPEGFRHRPADVTSTFFQV